MSLMKELIEKLFGDAEDEPKFLKTGGENDEWDL
jgi:hypothetical protein